MVALKQGPTYVKEFNYDEFQGFLSGLGDSLILVNDDEIAKVPVTQKTGLILQEGLKYVLLKKLKLITCVTSTMLFLKKIKAQSAKLLARSKRFRNRCGMCW